MDNKWRPQHMYVSTWTTSKFEKLQKKKEKLNMNNVLELRSWKEKQVLEMADNMDFEV